MGHPCHVTSQNRPTCQLPFFTFFTDQKLNDDPHVTGLPNYTFNSSHLFKILYPHLISQCALQILPSQSLLFNYPINVRQRLGIINLFFTDHTFISILLLLRLIRPLFLLRQFDPRIIFPAGEADTIHQLIHKDTLENLCSAHFDKYLPTYVRLALNTWLSQLPC
jgi:hypothetical protein